MPRKEQQPEPRSIFPLEGRPECDICGEAIATQPARFYEGRGRTYEVCSQACLEDAWADGRGPSIGAAI